jgi:transcriptional regulatory protein RtcR
MATLASGGRISEDIVGGEISRLKQAWSGFQNQPAHRDHLKNLLDDETLAAMDLFDRLQLNAVVDVCLSSVSLAQAGRTLFNASRTQKASSNDSHRLKQYLAKFGLGFGQILSGLKTQQAK